MRFRTARDLSLFPNITRQFDSVNATFQSWGWEFRPEGVYLETPELKIIFIPSSNIDWIENPYGETYNGQTGQTVGSRTPSGTGT